MFRSRRKTSELPKLSLAVVIGYLLKTITMSDNQCSQTCPSCAPATEKCSICITCQPSTPLCPLSDADNEPLKEPSKPKNMYEVLRYDYFNKSQIFNNFDDDPRIWLLRHQSDDIKDMTTQLIQLYNKADSKNWHFSKLVNGYRRYDPLRGEEYLIDAELTTEQINDIGQRETVFNSVRFEAVKPVTKLRLLSSTKYNNKQTIYFILPLTHLNDRFKNFVKNVAAVGWTKPGENVCLLIVLFALQSTEMKTFLEEIKQEFPLADFRIIETQGEFSRGLGLDLASRQLSNSSLLFFCDVDVNVTETFLQRCRQNAVQGQQVYYPMVFAQYTPSLILKYAPPGVHVDEINKYTGQFRLELHLKIAFIQWC